MATVKHKAYETLVDNVLTTGLNSLANTARAISSAQDNTTNLNLYADFELEVEFAAAPVEGAPVDLYIIPSVDGIQYADGSDSVNPPQNCFAGFFAARAVNSDQILVLRDVLLPPGLWKAVLRNSAGQAMEATGNILAYRAHNISVVT